MNHKCRLSIVIPVFNAELSLPQLCHDLVGVLGQTTSQTYEIILIDDCSTDDSWEKIQGLAAENSNIRGMQLSRNYGQHNALLCGIRAAHGEIIITMDDDQQHPPSEIPKLVAALTDDLDVVYGSPADPKHNIARLMASRATKWVLQRTMGAAAAKNASALRIFRRSLTAPFQDNQSQYVNIDIMLTWVTNRFGAITVEHGPRMYGRTGYTFGKLVQHAINLVTGFSTIPLQIASLVGFLFSLLGLAALGYTLAVYFMYGSTVPGFAFLASLISIFSGVQLLTIGIIGEYLARIHMRSQNNPAYVVRETI